MRQPSRAPIEVATAGCLLIILTAILSVGLLVFVVAKAIDLAFS